MDATIDRERFARIALSFVAEPGDLTLGGMLRRSSPGEGTAIGVSTST